MLFQLRVHAFGVDDVVDFEGEEIARAIGRAYGKDRVRDEEAVLDGHFGKMVQPVGRVLVAVGAGGVEIAVKNLYRQAVLCGKAA